MERKLQFVMGDKVCAIVLALITIAEMIVMVSRSLPAI